MTDAPLTAASPAQTDHAAPLDPPRAWWQFSLRTLLVLVTLIAVPLAWFVSGPERQRRAVNELLARGVYLDFEREAGGVPGDECWLPEAYFRRVREVFISRAKHTDELLEIAAELPGVTLLTIRQSDTTAKGAAYLGTMTSLKVLTLGEPQSDDTWLPHIGKLRNLVRLDMTSDHFTGAGLVHLQDLTNLEGLFFWGAPLDDQGLQHLQKMTKLKSLRLPPSISDAGLIHLTPLQSLQELNLRATRIQGAGLLHLQALPALQYLNMRSSRLEDDGLVFLTRCPALNNVDVRNTRVTIAGVEKLLFASKLTYLWFDEDEQKASEEVARINAELSRRQQ